MKWLFRILVVIVSLPVVALLVLFLLSRRPDAGVTRSTVTIARPAAEVWPWLTEPARLRQWVSWLVEIRGAEPGPPRVGMTETWVMTNPDTKETTEMVSTLTAVEPPTRIAVRIEAKGGFTGTQEFQLTEHDGRTDLASVGRFAFTNGAIALLEPLVTPEARKKQQRDLETLRRLAEAAPAPAPDSTGTP